MFWYIIAFKNNATTGLWFLWDSLRVFLNYFVDNELHVTQWIFLCWSRSFSSLLAFHVKHCFYSLLSEVGWPRVLEHRKDEGQYEQLVLISFPEEAGLSSLPKYINPNFYIDSSASFQSSSVSILQSTGRTC